MRKCDKKGVSELDGIKKGETIHGKNWWQAYLLEGLSGYDHKANFFPFFSVYGPADEIFTVLEKNHFDLKVLIFLNILLGQNCTNNKEVMAKKVDIVEFKFFKLKINAIYTRGIQDKYLHLFWIEETH